LKSPSQPHTRLLKSVAWNDPLPDGFRMFVQLPWIASASTGNCPMQPHGAPTWPPKVSFAELAGLFGLGSKLLGLIPPAVIRRPTAWQLGLSLGSGMCVATQTPASQPGCAQSFGSSAVVLHDWLF